MIHGITLQAVSCLVGTGAVTVQIKGPECEVEWSPHLVPEVRN